MTIKRAREILDKRAEKYTDKEISKILLTLTILVNKVIDQVVDSKNIQE